VLVRVLFGGRNQVADREIRERDNQARLTALSNTLSNLAAKVEVTAGAVKD
jgi:hypothetical protein